MNRKERRYHAKIIRERDHVLRSLDVVAYYRYMVKYNPGLFDAMGPLSKPDVIKASMHKARVCIYYFTPEEKRVSAEWRLANDYKLPDGITFVDGVVRGSQPH